MSKGIYEITGFKELQAKIKLLPDKVKVKEMRKILRISAKPTVDAAREQAPESKKSHSIRGGKRFEPGNLKKSIKVAVMGKARSPMVVVGPRSKGKYDGFYGRQFVIEGHNLYRAGFRRNKKGNRTFNAGGSVGKVAANPFMERAMNKTKGRVADYAVAKTEKYIQKQISKL